MMQLIGEFPAVQARHDDVGQQQIDPEWTGVELREGRRAVRGLTDPVVQVLQRLDQIRSHVAFVLHHQDGFASQTAD
jgi:hypothetical protein